MHPRTKWALLRIILLGGGAHSHSRNNLNPNSPAIGVFLSWEGNYGLH